MYACIYLYLYLSAITHQGLLDLHNQGHHKEDVLLYGTVFPTCTQQYQLKPDKNKNKNTLVSEVGADLSICFAC
jgi:hypothetical protein